MQISIPWSSSVFVFVIERMAIIYSLKCAVPFSFVVPLLSLAVTYFHLLSLVATCCITHCHSISLVVPLVITRCHSLSLAVPQVFTCYHSLSLDVPLVCLFINDLILSEPGGSKNFHTLSLKWFLNDYKTITYSFICRLHLLKK